MLAIVLLLKRKINYQNIHRQMGPPSYAMVALSPHTSGTGSWEGVPYVHAHHRLGQVSAFWRRFPKTALYLFSF